MHYYNIILLFKTSRRLDNIILYTRVMNASHHAHVYIGYPRESNVRLYTHNIIIIDRDDTARVIRVPTYPYTRIIYNEY